MVKGGGCLGAGPALLPMERAALPGNGGVLLDCRVKMGS